VKITMRVLLALFASVLLLAACSQQDKKPAASTASPAAPPAAGPHAEVIPTQAQLDRFRAEGPDPTLRKISVADYWLHYRLMQATGIEKELGGEAQTIEALKALGEAYERRLRVAEVEAPKMIPAQFTGEGMTSGFVGMGMGSFLGMISGGMVSSAVSSMSDERLAELNKSGSIKHGNDSGSSEFQFAKDGSMTQSMEFEVNEHGVNGKVKMKSKMDACPDESGKVTVETEVDSQMSVSGKPGTGGSVRTQFKYERYLDDDAHLVDTADGAASSLHVRMGGMENFESQFVDITTGHKRGGETSFEHHDEGGFSIFRMDEVERMQKLLQATELLQTLMAEAMVRGLTGGSPWESGRCIDLKVTSDPAKRKGVRPSTAFDLEAKPRAKEGGATVGGTVTATLSGGASLQPASGKVEVDAKYGYTGPEKKDESASISFESRSKRGVGKATLEFDTKALRAYRMEGGAGDFHGVGQVCDLEQQFFVEGGGNTVRFEPSSAAGGSYSYSGVMSGFRVYGHGTYTVKYRDEVAVGITAKGPGSVVSPAGTHSGEGTEEYQLTPLQDANCS
jgi:hypothetical protein